MQVGAGALPGIAPTQGVPGQRKQHHRRAQQSQREISKLFPQRLFRQLRRPRGKVTLTFLPDDHQL